MLIWHIVTTEYLPKIGGGSGVHATTLRSAS